MKSHKTTFAVIVSIPLILLACHAQKKAELEFPEAMLPYVKVEYEKRSRQGEVLYALNCAKCHNTEVRGKQVVPDFKPDELRGYALRVSNAKHEQNMPDSLVSEEDLAIIMTFLNYKKKNSLPQNRN